MWGTFKPSREHTHTFEDFCSFDLCIAFFPIWERSKELHLFLSCYLFFLSSISLPFFLMSIILDLGNYQLPPLLIVAGKERRQRQLLQSFVISVIFLLLSFFNAPKHYYFSGSLGDASMSSLPHRFLLLFLFFPFSSLPLSLSLSSSSLLSLSYTQTHTHTHTQSVGTMSLNICLLFSRCRSWIESLESR